MSLNILYHHRTQGRGAEGHHIVNIVRALRDLGHRVTVLSPPGVDPFDVEANDASLSSRSDSPLPTHRPSQNRLRRILAYLAKYCPNGAFELVEMSYNLIAWFRLQRLVRSQRFDLIYERYAFYMIAGALLARRHGIPFVLEANEVSGISLRVRPQSFPRLTAWFERIVFSRCTSIQAVSLRLKNMIIQRGVDGSRVRVVPNAFDVRHIPLQTESAKLRSQLELDGCKVIGFAGWFSPWDRLDMIIAAMPSILATHPTARLLLVGDGQIATELKQRAMDAGLGAAVLFTGRVDRSVVLDYLALFDLLVLPHSNDYGSPVVMFECMGLKVPVIAPSLPPILDVHVHKETALLFEPLNQEQMVAHIRCLLDAPDQRKNLALKAFNLLTTQHSWRRNAEILLDSSGAVRL
jgi:glycosyltransferase involved in cell wall biosynthesis